MNEVVAEQPVAGVFLSYSSEDRATALKLKGGLERLGVAVRIDVEATQGQAIREFILESIRTTVATVLVVSEAALLSNWVAVEVSISLADAELWKKRKFVACYLDQCFLDATFRLRATDAIDAELARIKTLEAEYSERRLDTQDLDLRRSRLYKLRNGLGDVLRYLKESLCVDVRGDGFDRGLVQLADALRPVAPGLRADPMGPASDIAQRKEEVYELVANGEHERALKRIMDVVHDFSRDIRIKQDIAVTKGLFRKLETEQNRPLQEVRSERTDLLYKGLDILEKVVDQLSQGAA
ncbi:MAG TPA: toll/interleukin-1 receptor domain-containing protein [Polyangiaceae bacterium]|nr:toll/interleukin-1 receptor domain-containing protein [Polyangiaceae bacterium]